MCAPGFGAIWLDIISVIALMSYVMQWTMKLNTALFTSQIE